MSGDQFSDILARISCGEVDEPEKSDVVEAEAMEGLNRNLQTPSANEPNREYCLQEDALMKVFRLTAIHRTSNMHAFAPDNSLKKYSDPREVTRFIASASGCLNLVFFRSLTTTSISVWTCTKPAKIARWPNY